MDAPVLVGLNSFYKPCLYQRTQTTWFERAFGRSPGSILDIIHRTGQPKEVGSQTGRAFRREQFIKCAVSILASMK